MYSFNFTVTKKKFCLSLHYNGANSYLLVKSTEIYKFKAKDSEIVAGPFCLGNISKNWLVDRDKLVKMIRDPSCKFGDYSISPKITQILLHWVMN